VQTIWIPLLQAVKIVQLLIHQVNKYHRKVLQKENGRGQDRDHARVIVMIKRTDVTGRSHEMVIGIARERGIGIVTERGARIESADRGRNRTREIKTERGIASGGRTATGNRKSPEEEIAQKYAAVNTRSTARDYPLIDQLFLSKCVKEVALISCSNLVLLPTVNRILCMSCGSPII